MFSPQELLTIYLEFRKKIEELERIKALPEKPFSAVKFFGLGPPEQLGISRAKPRLHTRE
jgi:hypothetical protein